MAGYHVTPDVLTITVDDLGNTDVVAGTLTTPATAQLPIQVNPKQDAPTIPALPTVPTNAVMEDTPYTLPAMQVFDVDVRSTLVVDVNTLYYDPDWVGR